MKKIVHICGSVLGSLNFTDRKTSECLCKNDIQMHSHIGIDLNC